ncbi:hypothetical protein J6590_005294 [Homalodisca vitripennis]|nr:hypothetical protein J6590_005294 [Homalodisca vitripennis]
MSISMNILEGITDIPEWSKAKPSKGQIAVRSSQERQPNLFLSTGELKQLSSLKRNKPSQVLKQHKLTSLWMEARLRRKEETWILAYLKIAGATTSMLPRLVSNATLLKTNNSIARINNSQGWLWGEAPEITARQHTSTQLCAGTGQVSSFLSPPVGDHDL